MPHSHSAPTRSLPPNPSLVQLKKQAKELFKAYQSGDSEAAVEVERFERRPDPIKFALADAQRVLARAYGFASWTRLKQHVEGVTASEFCTAVSRGDVATVRRLAKARPELVDAAAEGYTGSPLHIAVLNHDAEMTRVLMRLSADARSGIWPHRDATSAHTIAKDRQFDDIVAVIEEEETRRRQSLGVRGAAVDGRTAEILTAIRQRKSEEALRILEADLSLVGSCDVEGRTPLHLAAWAHDPVAVAWLLGHGAGVDARDAAGKTPLDHAAESAGWSANDHFFPYLYNARIAPARFDEVVRLLRSHGAALTPRAAVAIGDGAAVMKMHIAGRLKNEIDFMGGGLLAIAARVNRIEMVRLLLDLRNEPDERATPTEDGEESWGFPLWFAAVCGRHEIAELLLERGADPSGILYASGDPLCCAEETGDTRMKELLIKYGARGATARVADSGDIETLRAILEGRIPGYSLNYENPSLADLAADSLWMGALNGNAEQVRLCLSYVKSKRDDALWNYVLVHAKTPEVVRIILEHDVDPDVVAAREYTILHHIASDYVAEENRVPFATLLLDAGASLEKRDALLKSTPLGWACRWGRTELVRLYLERGADPVESEAELWATPLAWATKGEHGAIIELLRSHGV